MVQWWDRLERQPVVYGEMFVCYDSQPSGNTAWMRHTGNTSRMPLLCSEAPSTSLQHWKQEEILDFFISADSKKRDQHCHGGLIPILEWARGRYTWESILEGALLEQEVFQRGEREERGQGDRGRKGPCSCRASNSSCPLGDGPAKAWRQVVRGSTSPVSQFIAHVALPNPFPDLRSYGLQWHPVARSFSVWEFIFDCRSSPIQIFSLCLNPCALLACVWWQTGREPGQVVWPMGWVCHEMGRPLSFPERLQSLHVGWVHSVWSRQFLGS